MTSSTPAPTGATLLLLTTSFVAGFSMMLVEVTATRLLAPFFGTSTFTWTNVIGAILAALAGGYFVGGKLADRAGSVSLTFSLVTIAGLLTALVPFGAVRLGRALLPAGDTLLASAPLALRGSLIVTLVVFIPPVLAMALLSPLLVRQLSVGRAVGWASGANSAAGTLGALLGTFAPTLWLVPAWGSRLTVLFAAGLQLLLAAAGFGLFRRTRAAMGALLLFVATLPLAFAARGPLYEGTGLVEEVETEYQYATVVREGDETQLRLEGQSTGSQSAIVDGSHLTGGAYYDYLLMLPFFLDRAPGAPLRVCVVGLAAGTVPRQYFRFFGARSPVQVTGIEIDPALIDLARRHFDLQASVARGLTVHVADGRAFLAQDRGTYDVIIVDVFANQHFIPFHLTTREFFREVRARLAPGGVAGMNVIAHSAPSDLLPALEATLADTFESTARVRIPRSFNVQLIARREAPLDPLAAGARIESWPGAGPAISEAGELRGLMLRGLAELSVFRGAPGARVLTDDHAPTEQLILADMRRPWRAR